MILDARSVPPGTSIDADVCIVGAGAAGISLAREFIDAASRVVLLESGGMDLDMATQALYEGESVGTPFTPLTVARLRYFGGTTNHWGGYCVPLDPIDFETRDGFPYHGWPFAKSHLDPWYARAQEVCRLGRYDYRPASWGIPASKIFPPFAGPTFEMKLLQENPIRFGAEYAPELQRAPRVTTYLHANAVHLDAGEANGEIAALTAKTLSGNSFTVRARIYVLAASGVENARLLLASGREGGNGLGNDHDMVGRFFMLHPVYSIGTVVPANPYMDFDFMTKGAWVPGKFRIDPFIGLTESIMRNLRLPNMMILLGFELAPVVGAIDAFKRLIHGEGPGGSRLEDLATVVRNFEGVTEFAARKLLFGEGVPIKALRVWGASEQQPNPRSRVTLGAKRDSLGMREVVADWQLIPEDRTKPAAIIQMLGAEIGRAGFGRLHSAFGEDGAWPDDFRGNEHQMGTTRMHHDPTQGVVNENCRLHTVSNLYVAGSSVFPTGGVSNPTLTIVALALRLADHIKEKLA